MKKKIKNMTEEEKANVQLVCAFILFPVVIIGGGCAEAGNWLFAIICLAVVVCLARVIDATGEEESD